MVIATYQKFSHLFRVVTLYVLQLADTFVIVGICGRDNSRQSPGSEVSKIHGITSIDPPGGNVS